jgi:multicomponent Na+:H+ antiporter subunit A
LGLLIGLFPDTVATPLVAPAVSAVRAEPTEIKLVLWHGVNPIFALSVLTVACGVGIYVGRDALRQAAGRFRLTTAWGVQRWYAAALDGLNLVARAQTRLLQSGYLRVYVLISTVVVLGLTGSALVSRGALAGGGGWREASPAEWVLAGLILAAAWVAVCASSLLAAAVALGGVGYGIALVYILFGAPDLAMTQVAVETLTVVLFVLVLYRHPLRFASRSGTPTRVRDGVVAAGVGGVITACVLTGTAEPVRSRLAPYFAENSLPLANGRNVVNVILVDFRALDTLGEITVLAVAAVGVYTLLKLSHVE